MKPEELREHCKKQKLSDSVTIVLKGNRRGESRRLSGAKSPLGRIVRQQPGSDIVMFKASEVLQWLDKMAAVLEVEA